jgi:alkylation response protein AidB-like acyl-CoA dehydrogenase
VNFDFDPQHYEFRDAFKSYLDKSYPLERHRRLLEGEGFDAQLWEGLAELGLFGMLVPQQYGGLGLTFVDLALVLEELGRALVPPPVAETLIATDVLTRLGSVEQQQRYLPRISSGKLRATIATSEPDGGFDPFEIATIVNASANNVLTGRKIMVPHAGIADLLLVTSLLRDGEPGIVVLESDRAGVQRSAHETLDPAARFHELRLDRVLVSKVDLIAGRDAISRLFDVGATAAALQLSGIAGRVLDIAVSYARSRVQFGKPIGSFQAIKHRCADMAVQTESSRSAAYYASWSIAEDAPERRAATSIAKSFCSEAARFVCNEGIQIHGGMGFTWELGLHFYLRRAKLLEYSWGDVAHHQERLMAATLANLTLGS